MKVVSQVGVTAIYLDWDSIRRDGGRLNQNVRFDRLLGLLLGSLAVALLVFALLTNFLLGKGLRLAPITLMLIGSAALIFAYSKYLKRNRSLFADSKLASLKDIGTVRDFEISTALDTTTRIIFDSAFAESEPLTIIAEKTLSNKDIQGYLRRLAIPKTTFSTKEIDWDLFFKHLVNVAIDLGDEQITIDAIFVNLLIHVWVEQLLNSGIQKSDIQSFYIWLKQHKLKRRYRYLWQKQAIINPKSTTNRGFTSVYGPNIEQNATDLTRLAASGKFELAVGRMNEVNEVLNLLSTSAANSILIVHQNGTGVDRVLANIAVRMVVEDVPQRLTDQRLVELNLTRLYAQTRELAAFKSKIQLILEEIARNKHMVLVLSEFEQVFNIDGSSAAEILNLIINYIGRTKIPVIAVVTQESYSRYIQPQSTLSSNFRIVKLLPLGLELTQQVLIDDLPRLEKKYGVEVELPALKQLMQLLTKLPSDLALPGKAEQQLEEICAMAPASGRVKITAEVVSKFVSDKIGVGVGMVQAGEAELLLGLAGKMHERIVGQAEAVAAVASSLQRARAGITNTNRPLASFLFYGPTGVGKTEVARSLAQIYFGGERSMVRLDMSEFQSSDALVKLVGDYRDGVFAGGQLTEAVRRQPHCLLLLDELEKASQPVLDLFLQVLDEGTLTDALGRSVDFTNCIIIATSNVASKEIAADIAAQKGYEQVRESTQLHLRNAFRIEFLNRFDRIVMFTPLDQGEVKQVLLKFIERLANSLQDRGIVLEIRPEALEQLAIKSYDAAFGAREARRVLQDQVEGKIAQLVIAGKLKSGQRVIISDLDNPTVV